MRRAVAIAAVVLATMGAKLSCTTGEGLPVHTKYTWLHMKWPVGSVVIIRPPGIKPGLVVVNDKRIPGTWTKKGNTYIGDHVWVWSAGHPNGQG